MVKSQQRKPETWLTLQSASEQVGVSPATLRHWADNGKVRAFRTPGGHRRFSETDMRALRLQTRPGAAASPTRDMERLIHGALGRARLEISGGRLEREMWYQGFDAAAKERLRELGHRLMTLLLEALREESDDAGLARHARTLGKEYGEASLSRRTSLADALRAFLFFRDYVFEDLIDLASRSASEENFNSLDVYRRLSTVTNEMLVSMVESYRGSPHA